MREERNTFIEMEKPSVQFYRRFAVRHVEHIKFGKPTRHYGKRWAVMNAKSLTSHLARIEQLVKFYSVDARRMWSLDETGTTPGGDVAGI